MSCEKQYYFTASSSVSKSTLRNDEIEMLFELLIVFAVEIKIESVNCPESNPGLVEESG